VPHIFSLALYLAVLKPLSYLMVSKKSRLSFVPSPKPQDIIVPVAAFINACIVFSVRHILEGLWGNSLQIVEKLL